MDASATTAAADDSEAAELTGVSEALSEAVNSLVGQAVDIDDSMMSANDDGEQGGGSDESFEADGTGKTGQTRARLPCLRARPALS